MIHYTRTVGVLGIKKKIKKISIAIQVKSIDESIFNNIMTIFYKHISYSR